MIFLKDIETAIIDLRNRDPKTFYRAYFLNEMRKALRTLRGDRSQEIVAERANHDQSEISRLENGLTDYTRIGSLLDYVEGCEGRLELNLFNENGELVSRITTVSADNLSQEDGVAVGADEQSIGVK